MKWTPEMDKRVTELRVEHQMSTSEIGAVMGLRKGQVIGRLDRLKVPVPAVLAKVVRVRKWTEELTERVRELRNEGKSSREIGRILNVSRNAVCGVVLRAKMPARPPGPVPMPRLVVARAPVPRVAIVRPDARTWPLAVLADRGRGCAYPVRGYGAETLFCAGPTDEGRTYCTYCHPIMYQPAATPSQRREAMRGYLRQAAR